MTTRVFHISDVHFGTENRAALNAVEQAVAREKPDAVVCTGDLTQRATHAQFAAARGWLDGLGVPIVLEPGNHDLPYYNLIERFTDPFRRYRTVSEHLTTSRDFADAVFVPLLTTVRAQRRFPWSDGVVTQAALRETVSAIEKLRKDPHAVIVTAHHPLLGPESAPANPTIGGDKAFAAIAKAGADAVLSGHIHVPFDTIREVAGARMRTIGAGTLSTRLRHDAPPSYRVLTCTKGREIETELRELPEAMLLPT